MPPTDFEYLYDFGDSWRHDLRLEAIVLPDPQASYPRCLAGERRAPPEDVGESPGYEDYLEAMADPGHEEHEDVLQRRGAQRPRDVYPGIGPLILKHIRRDSVHSIPI
jgi:hypothetical protein